MHRLWHRLGQHFGLDEWAEVRGAVDGEQYQEWTSGLARYSEEQIARGVEGALSHTSPVTLDAFCKLCLRAPPEAKASQSVIDREKERQRRIRFSPKSREPSPGDVESFDFSYHNCGCGNRWPGRVPG